MLVNNDLSLSLSSPQKDELDGEIDLRSCLKVSEFDVEKNYGFQIEVTTFTYLLNHLFSLLFSCKRCCLFSFLTHSHVHSIISLSHTLTSLPFLVFLNSLLLSPSSSLSASQTVSGVFTLSAMTAGIRRNWIEVLRKNIRPSSTPDLTQ